MRTVGAAVAEHRELCQDAIFDCLVVNENAMSSDDAFEKTLAVLPLTTYRAGETIMTEGSKSGRLLILKRGAVVILKDLIEIARVTSLALFSVSSPRCWINRTQRTLGLGGLTISCR